MNSDPSVSQDRQLREAICALHAESVLTVALCRCMVAKMDADGRRVAEPRHAS